MGFECFDFDQHLKEGPQKRPNLILLDKITVIIPLMVDFYMWRSKSTEDTYNPERRISEGFLLTELLTVGEGADIYYLPVWGT